jgi:hypothetical protein
VVATAYSHARGCSLQPGSDAKADERLLRRIGIAVETEEVAAERQVQISVQGVDVQQVSPEAAIWICVG